MNHNHPIRYLSVCSGIEAATAAWHPLGWSPVGFSEIEPFPSAVLAHHYPSIPNYGDMTQHAAWPLKEGDIDLLVGGTPCQSFSVAGLRAGLSDPRGGLMLTYLEIARSLRPRWVVWENVPGVLSSGGGRDFGSFLGALGELGYGWAYRVLDAQWFGVPQRRRRVFVVASLGDNRAAKVLFERESVCGDSETIRETRKTTSFSSEGGSGANVVTSHEVALCLETTCNDYSRADGFTMIGHPVFRKSRRAQSSTDDETWVPATVANTLNQFDTGERDTHGVVDGLHVRRLTPRECERLQGFPDDYTAIPWRGKAADQCPDSPRYKSLGNSMAVNCMAWIGKRIQAVETYHQ